MQFKKLPIPLTVMALALTTAFSLLPRLSLAEGQKGFFCGMADGKPATLAWTEVGNVVVIVWGRTIAGMPPLKRCEIVSERMERFSKQDQLKYLTIGKVNGSPVICATESRDGFCSSSNLLVTLLPNDNSRQILKELINGDIQVGSSRRTPLNGIQTIEMFVRDDGFASVDIQRVIDFRAGRKIRVFPQD